GLFKFNEGIVDFGKDFGGYGDELVEFVNEKNKVELGNGVKVVGGKGKRYEEEREKEVDGVEKLRREVGEDGSNFERE
ncbi:HBL/NHE enterotoxin family protein, partial [Bacillus thuringiensis]|uniref:HBL/NHE enterotoxin family protein n=1 Tax=Bacillus thuringiensis TaxID=1428 RepID=UPI00119D0ACB